MRRLIVLCSGLLGLLDGASAQAPALTPFGAAGGALYNTLINKGSHRTYRSRSYYSNRSATSGQSAPRYRSYRHR